MIDIENLSEPILSSETKQYSAKLLYHKMLPNVKFCKEKKDKLINYILNDGLTIKEVFIFVNIIF